MLQCSADMHANWLMSGRIKYKLKIGRKKIQLATERRDKIQTWKKKILIVHVKLNPYQITSGCGSPLTHSRISFVVQICRNNKAHATSVPFPWSPSNQRIPTIGLDPMTSTLKPKVKNNKTLIMLLP